jgi:hypothetical protein
MGRLPVINLSPTVWIWKLHVRRASRRYLSFQEWRLVLEELGGCVVVPRIGSQEQD